MEHLSILGGPRSNHSVGSIFQNLARPLYVEPRPFNHLTSASDIESLNPGEELDLQCIMVALERVTRLCPGTACLLDTHALGFLPRAGETHNLDPSFEALRCQVASVPLGGFVLLPMCENGHHFLLVFRKYCLKSSGVAWEVRVYDSFLLSRFHGRNNMIKDEYWDYISDKIRVLYEQVFSYCTPAQALGVHFMLCPQQPNAYDCGVAVVLNAIEVIVNEAQRPLKNQVAEAILDAPGFQAGLPTRGDWFTHPSDSIDMLSLWYDLGLYWQAGRNFVFQLCTPSVEHLQGNQDNLPIIQENVSFRLQKLLMHEQNRAQTEGLVYFQQKSKEALLDHIEKLLTLARSVGTPARMTEDASVFASVVNPTINPEHEHRLPFIIQAAYERAHHDPGMVRDLAADLETAKQTLEGVQVFKRPGAQHDHFGEAFVAQPSAAKFQNFILEDILQHPHADPSPAVLPPSCITRHDSPGFFRNTSHVVQPQYQPATKRFRRGETSTQQGFCLNPSAPPYSGNMSHFVQPRNQPTTMGFRQPSIRQGLCFNPYDPHYSNSMSHFVQHQGPPKTTDFRDTSNPQGLCCGPSASPYSSNNMSQFVQPQHQIATTGFRDTANPQGVYCAPSGSPYFTQPTPSNSGRPPSKPVRIIDPITMQPVQFVNSISRPKQMGEQSQHLLRKKTLPGDQHPPR